MKKPTTWSYSALSQFEKCPKQYEYARIQKLPQPPSKAMERGNAIHAQLERALKADIAGVPEVSLVEYVAALRKRKPVVEEMWHFDRKWNFVGKNFGPSSWLLVKMDAYVPPVLGKKPRNPHVIDWKTGGIYDDHETQAELYAIAAVAKEGAGRVTEVDVDMVYVDKAHVEKWSLPIENEATFDEIAGAWTDRAQGMLSTTEYRAKPGKSCSWCPFSARKGGPCRAG
jgi:CRISPR/Cas system-associated exonuclease Cas4 (RecB family)